MKVKNLLKSITKTSNNKNSKSKNNDLSILNKRYIIGELIDKGGLSEVYEVKDIYNEYFNKESNAVIKIPNNKLLEKKDVAAFIYSEYSFLRDLKHDNIVNVLDFGIDKKTNIPYLVLEYISGNLLEDELIDDMTLEYKNKMFKSLHNTIKYIHSQNIIHADISPSNIIVNNEKFTIFDFGISQNIKNKKDFSLEYNNSKAFNPKYCAPEVLKGEVPTVKSDIFSFACVMYEIYTKKQFIIDSSLELYDKKSDIDLAHIPYVLKKWFIYALDIKASNRKMDSFLIKFLK